MSFYNAGCYDGNRRIKTKKALREALKADPSTVYFDGTSMFDKVSGYKGDEIPDGVTVSVVGPDPFTKRSWYASVSRVNGSIKVA